MPRAIWILVVLVGCQAPASHSPVTHGPVLGRPATDSMTVWARLGEPGTFHVHYGLSPDELVGRVESSPARLADDLTALATLEELEPGTRYHYEIHGATCEKRREELSGSFLTLPDPETLRDPEHNPDGLFNFSFEFACGNNQSPGDGLGPSLPAYDTLNRLERDRLHFAILNGDWLYEEDRDHSVETWARDHEIEELPRVVGLAPTLVGVWENYKTYLARAKNLAAWHRHVPSFYTFDDHEILNDVFGSGTPGFRNRRAVFRDIAVKAWFDYLGWSNPVVDTSPAHFGRARLEAGSDVLVDEEADFTSLDPATAPTLHVHWGTPDAGVKDIPAGDTEGGDPNANVYRIAEVIDRHRLRLEPPAVATGTSSYSIARQAHGTFRVGNCRFFLLDTRTHRQLHDIQDPEKDGLSMLGTGQRDWLIENMRRGDADFYFVISSVNFMIPHVGGGGAAFDAATKDDAWTVFLQERERLIEVFDSMEQPVFVLTGDLHNSFAIRVTDNVWEFASGPHNSVNHRPQDEGMRPVNGPFQYGPRACEILWSTTALADIPRENRLFPHYCVVEVRNVFDNPRTRDGTRRVAYPVPHVIFRYHDALTGEFRYAETIHAHREP